MAEEEGSRIPVSGSSSNDSGWPRSVRSGQFPTSKPLPAFTPVPNDSPAKRRDVLDVQERVEALVREQQLAILRIVGRVIWFALLPVMFLFFALRLGTQQSSWLGIEFIGLVVGGLGASVGRLPFPLRGLMTVFGVTVGALVALMHFGPTISVGFFYVAAILLAATVLRPRGAYGVGVVLWGAVVALGIASHDVSARATGTFPSPEWLRLIFTSGVAIFALLYLFLRFQKNLWSAVEGQMVLRVSERRLVEERETVLRAASTAQRLESLGRLAGGIAHDFNNSLVVIQCNLEALAEDLDPGEKGEVLREVTQGVERAAATARQLLSFAKRNVEEIGSCDPGVVARRLTKDANRLLPVSVRLEVEASVATRVALTPTAVEQLLMIFIQNAREALGQRAGTVIVSVKPGADQRVRLEVLDDGPGMPLEVLEQACEPFFTTRGDSHAGLGLSTAWGMVQRQGGELVVESEPGRGTRVVVALPSAPLEAVPAPREKLASRIPKEEEHTVLVLEDEPPVRAAFRRILRHLGLHVVEAGTVSEAREACKHQRFSLLISDGILPDGGVGHFIQDFRREQRAPVILCSGYTEEDLALEGLARGECTFLPKPFSAAELNARVGELLAKKAGKIS